MRVLRCRGKGASVSEGRGPISYLRKLRSKRGKGEERGRVFRPAAFRGRIQLSPPPKGGNIRTTAVKEGEGRGARKFSNCQVSDHQAGERLFKKRRSSERHDHAKGTKRETARS